MAALSLLVGLGNPGSQYADTRHNAGFMWIDEIAHRYNATLNRDKKFFGESARISIGGEQIWLLKPETYMNRSGQAVVALANFYKIPTESILVAHDELDLDAGTIRLKSGGGDGGHNGLKDTTLKLGSNNYLRLRIGIGHPGHRSEVTNYVLGKPPATERELIGNTIDRSADILELLIRGETQQAIQQLHSGNR